MEVKERIEYIDLAKGICIILVLFFHIGQYGTRIETSLFFFRMPLYFFISGLFFKSYNGFKFFIVKKINKLIIPFLFFYFVAILVGFLGDYFFNLYEKGIINEPFHWTIFFDVFLKLGQGKNIAFNSPIWFLLSLFEVNVIFYLLYSCLEKKYLLIVSLLIGFIVLEFGINGLPYFLDLSLKYLPFFTMGFILKEYLLKTYRTSSIFTTIILIGLLLYLYYCAGFSREVQNNFFFYYSTGLCGILGVFIISKKLTRLPIFSYLGRYSLIVLGFHTFFVGPLHYIYSFQSVIIEHFVILLTIVMLMYLVVIPFSISFLPYFVAQKDCFSIKQ